MGAGSPLWLTLGHFVYSLRTTDVCPQRGRRIASPSAPLPATLAKPRCKARGRARQKVRANTETPSSCFLWTLLCGMLCRCSGVVPARSLTPMAAKQKQDNSICCCFALCRRREVAATRRGEVCIVFDPPHSSPPRLCDSRERGPGGERHTRSAPVLSLSFDHTSCGSGGVCGGGFERGRFCGFSRSASGLTAAFQPPL